MTMLATIAFPDEIILMCDSRISYYDSTGKKTSHLDKLKKIYQLKQHLLLAFTTENVTFTSKLIEKMTIKSKTMQSMRTSEFIDEITKYAKEEYKRLPGRKPKMEFIYAGFDFKSKLRIDSKKLKSVLDKCKARGKVPDKLEDVKISSKKTTIISPPSPLLVKQSFPSGKVIVTKGWDMGTSGAGNSFISDLGKYYPRIFSFPGTFNKAVILKNLADDYIEEQNIDTVGGLVQLFAITKDGVMPLQYVEKGQGKQVKTYIDNHGNWIEEDLVSGKKTTVVQNVSA